MSQGLQGSLYSGSHTLPSVLRDLINSIFSRIFNFCILLSLLNILHFLALKIKSKSRKRKKRKRKRGKINCFKFTSPKRFPFTTKLIKEIAYICWYHFLTSNFPPVSNFFPPISQYIPMWILLLPKYEIILVKITAAAKSLQSCPTLCDPIDGSPTGSPVPGILQARTLEWVAISFSNAWKWSRSVMSDS